VNREEKRAGTARILIQNRANAQDAPGGDTVVMNHLSKGLSAAGYEVVVDLNGSEDPANYDLIHLINFALPDMIDALGKRAKAAGTPFVVTTLCEDVASFHNQSRVLASLMIEYVNSNQNKSWLQQNWQLVDEAGSAEHFDNQWVYENAAALLVNGEGEREILEKNYGKNDRIQNVSLGFTSITDASPRLFTEKYGLRDFVLSVGRLESRKNQLMLLKALEDSDLPVVLVSGGFTYQPDYAQAVSNFKRKGETLILDRLDDQMLASAYAAARVHALPSWFELPGLVSLEAARSNCQIVAVKRGTTFDYLGDDAFYCQPDDPDSIKNSVLAAYYTPVSDSIKRRVSQFTWENFISQTLEVYQRILPAGEQRGVIETSQVSLPEEIEVMLEQAENAAREKRFDDALEQLNQIDQHQPNLARVNRNRGAIYLAQNDHNTAKGYFTLAHRAEPANAKTLSGLGMCLMMEKKPSEAYPLFLEALDIEPYQLVTLLQLLECAYTLEIYSDLELALAKYVQAHQDDLDMRYCYAGCLYKQRRTGDARMQLDRVLEKKPDHQGAAELLQKIEAELTHRGAASAKNSYPDVQSKSIDQQIGDLQELKQRREYESVRDLGLALLADQPLTQHQREQVQLLIADASALLEDLEQASQIYRDVLATNNRCARAWCGQGALDASQKDWVNAETKFKQAIELDASCDAAISGLAICASQKGDNQQAWDLYQQALGINPENSRAILGVLSLGYPLGKYAEIERALRDYLELHPADLNMLYSLAGCLFAQQRVDEARNELEKILIFDQDHSHAHELLDKIGMNFEDSQEPSTIERR